MSLTATAPISWYLLLAAMLFAIGAIGALTRRNGISIFLSIEVMLNAANLTLVAYARQLDQRTGQILVFFVFAVAQSSVRQLRRRWRLRQNPRRANHEHATT